MGKFFKRIRPFYLQVLFVFLAFVIMVLVSYFYVRGMVQEQMLSYSERTIGSAEYEIKSILSQYEISLHNFAFSTEHMIKNNYSQSEILVHFKNWTEWLSSNQENFQEFSGVYGVVRGDFLDGTGWVPPDDYVPQSRPWYVGAAALNGRTYYTVPYTDVDTGEIVISLSVTIYDIDYSRAGVLAIDVNISSIVEYVSTLNMANDGYGVMLNEKMVFVMHPNSDYTGVNIVDAGNDNNYAEIGKLISNGEPVSAVVFTDTDGNKSIAYFRTLFNNWLIGIVTPLASYNRNVTQLAIVLSVLGFVLMSILSYFLIMLSIAKTRSDEASKSKSDFLATMSHEIRTPLNAVIGIAQIELEKDDTPDDHTEAFEKIFNSGNGLLGIINDILDMSKIETGKMEINPEQYDVPSLINDSVMLNIGRIGTKPIEFILNVDENLPLKLIGDELRIKQILSNLLSNAFKYTDSGFVKMTIYHSTEVGNFSLHFIIEDSGQGMKPEDKERIFSEYSRFNAMANRTTEGTGIGMSITKRLIEMMDGMILVESEYGKGSTFTVMVKQETVDCEVIGTKLAQQLKNFTFHGEGFATHTTHEQMAYGNVLVVDDVDINLYVAEGMMSQYGLNIETALSGFEAIDLVNSGKIYDVIFMDHMMPQMDGIETAKKLRDDGYNGCIVALTQTLLSETVKCFWRTVLTGSFQNPLILFNLTTS
ncbi:MAG: ATP-binding protein [Oscillospiraceae bacterium]|nr:ATP-binding protein [Oscillospiraceae bacterium]